MLELATTAVEAALAAGARYAEPAVMIIRYESMEARNRRGRGPHPDRDRRHRGAGADRLLVGVPGHAGRPRRRPPAAPGERAAGVARQAGHRNAARPGAGAGRGGQVVLDLRGPPARRREPVREGRPARRRHVPPHDAGIPLAQAAYQVWDTEKWFASSEGSRIGQHMVECGAVMDATAIGDGETQRRSYPGVRGQYGTQGWEVRDLDLLGNAPRMAEQAKCPPGSSAVPGGTTTLDARHRPGGATDPRVGRPRHRARSHPGWEAAFAGTSWLDPTQLGALRFGSEVMKITADATLPGAIGPSATTTRACPPRRSTS